MCTGVKPAKLPRASSRPSDKIFDMTEVKNWFFCSTGFITIFFSTWDSFHFGGAFFLNMLCPNHPIRILSNEAESPRNFQRKEPPTDSSFHLSIHSCSSVFVDAQSLKESEEIQTSATNAGKPITVVWVVRFVWLLLVVVLGFCCSQLSCFWFGYLVALCFACLLGGGFERCERWEKNPA